MFDRTRAHGRTIPLTIPAAMGVVVVVLASGGGGGPLLASLGAIGALMTAMSLVMLLERHALTRSDDPGASAP